MTTIALHVPRRLKPVIQYLAAAIAGFGCLLIFLTIAGFPLGPGVAALWDGAFGSWYNFTSAVLVRATPLIVLGLAFTIGAQGGALNIGMEGQFAAGAIGATAVALAIPALPPPVAVLLTLAGGVVGGAIWIALPVLLWVRLGITEVISTLLLNFVAAALVSYTITGPLQEPARLYPQSSPIPMGTRLPHLWAGSRLHAGFVVALVIAALCSVLLSRTRWGFALRATGANARAAAVTGRLPVRRIAAMALLASGALAGLGGGIEVSGVSYGLYQNLSPGYGFTAIAVALLARLDPLLVITSGILFGALEAGAAAMQRDAGVPAVAVQVVEGVVIVVMLLATRRQR